MLVCYILFDSKLVSFVVALVTEVKLKLNSKLWINYVSSIKFQKKHF